MDADLIQQTQLVQVALSGRILGTLFYCAPDSQENLSLLTTMTNNQWIDEWPYGNADQLQQIALLLSQENINKVNKVNKVAESLPAAYQRLFIGPDPLRAPPWGSVYLDKENVLFGDSLLALRQWLTKNNIITQGPKNEPEDHIGLLFMTAAWLAEQHETLLDEFLILHLIPWAPRYLSLLEQHANHDFYQGLAKLAQLTLHEWITTYHPLPKPITLYF